MVFISRLVNLIIWLVKLTVNNKNLGILKFDRLICIIYTVELKIPKSL